MFRKTCEAPSCGKTYEAKKQASRFCSPTCRQRANRAKKSAEQPGGAVVGLPAPSVPSGTSMPRVRLSVYDAALRELEKAERVDTPNGQHALLLAWRLDHGITEAGSAFAALGRDFRAAMSAATADVEGDEDELDGFRSAAFTVIAGGRV